MSPDLRRILLEAVIIFTLGVMIGLAVNYRLVLNLLEGGVTPVPEMATTPETVGEDRYPSPVGLEEMRELLASGALPVDARAAELFREGHLPGARSLPLGEVDARLAGFRREVAAGRVIITYCSGYGCSDSFDLAMHLLQAGYRNVRVFEGGYPEWRDAGLPVREERE